MEERSNQNAKNPPSIKRLANLLQNPDLLSMHLNYQSTREAFLDIAYQLDDFQKTMSLFEEAESRYMKLTDMQTINQNIQKINVEMDRNSTDLSTEIRELRQYFSFQIKELNTKVDHNLTNVINELTKPIAAAPAPANNGENTIYDDNAYKSLRSEMDTLKERFESLMDIISKPMTEQFNFEEEEEHIEIDTTKIEGGEENISHNPNPSESSEKNEIPTTPTSAKKEDNFTSPEQEKEKENPTTTNEENNDKNPTNSNTEKNLNESTSTPTLVTTKQITANLKSTSMNAFKKIIEMRLDDIKIQLNKLNTQVTENEEKLNLLIPNVQRNSAENSMLRPELMKVKADVLLLKGDIDIMKDLQANSSVDFMKSIKEQVSKVQAPAVVDIEKPLSAMRSQIMQQFARMENAFNEQLKKLKAEIIGIKNLALSNASDSKSSNIENGSANQSLINDDDDQIKVVDTFANEEPAEKVLLKQMQKEAEEDRKKSEEELDRLTKEAQEAASLASTKAKEEREREIEIIQKSEEEKFIQQSSQLTIEIEKESIKKEEYNSSLKQVEIETDADESSKLHFDKFTEVKNIPNQLIVSVLADLPPKNIHKVVHKENDSSDFFTDEKENSNNDLSVNPTIAFEYARIGTSSEDDLDNVKRDIQCHQEIIEKIVSQISEISQTKIEVPALSSVPSQEKNELFALTEIKALKDASLNHQRSIDDLNLKVDQLITLSNFANLSEDEKKDKKILEEILQHQNELKQLQASNPSSNTSNFQQRQIVLSPVHFTPLNLEPLKVYKAKSSKDKTSSKTNKSKNEPPKQKNPKKQKKQQHLPPNKEAPAPALSNKQKEETVVTIEVPPKPSSIESKNSQSKIKDEKDQSSTSSQKQEETNKEQNENLLETNNEEENNEIENENDEENNENEFNDENDEIQNEMDETHKSPKSSHRSSSHHSSRHSSRHHSPSHHSSRSPKSDTKSQDQAEKISDEKQQEEAETNDKTENPSEKNPEGQKEEKITEEEEKEKTLLDEEEEEHLSNNSAVEFFSPAESSVGSSVVFESNQANVNDEEEEEEEEGMDPVLVEKLAQLNDMLTSHQEQIKNIREGLVEIRSTVQQVKMEIKDQRSTLLLPQLKENSSVESLERSKSSFDINQQIGDDNAIRAVRRRFDMQTREFENELYEIRKEIMEIRLEQSKAPQMVTERIIQVPANNYQQNQSPVPSSPENNEDDETKKKKSKKESIFSDENKLLEIKPISLPNMSSTPNKVPKLPIIDQQSQALQSFTPLNYPTQQGSLIVTNTKQTRTQPTTPKQKRLPPILPSSSSTTKKENQDENQTENEIENNENIDSKSLSARVNNDRHPFFNNVVQQPINELSVLNAANDVDEHILNLVVEVRSQLMLAIDKNTKRLNQIEAKIENFVDKDYVQKFFQKMRAVITEMNSNVTMMKQALPERVTKDEMQNLIEELYHSLTSDQETSGGTSNYRCLLCGRPKTSISGMIKDFKVAESLGQPTQTTVTQSPNAGARGTLIYGPDKQMYRGKGNFGRPTIASDSKKQLPKMK